MIVLKLPHLLIKADDLDLVKADSEEKITKVSRFRLFRPSTWFLEPVTTKETKCYIQIFYRKYGVTSSFQYYTAASNCVPYMDDLTRQVKIQMNATNQEMVDKLFENAIASN